MFSPLKSENKEFLVNSPHPLTDFSHNELYRLFVDANLVRKESGWMEFEGREKNCLFALCKAAEYAYFENLDEKTLTDQLIKHLHFLATTKVDKISEFDVRPGQYKEYFNGFGLVPTKQDLLEILRFIKEQQSYDDKSYQAKTRGDLIFNAENEIRTQHYENSGTTLTKAAIEKNISNAIKKAEKHYQESNIEGQAGANIKITFYEYLNGFVSHTHFINTKILNLKYDALVNYIDNIKKDKVMPKDFIEILNFLKLSNEPIKIENIMGINIQFCAPCPSIVNDLMVQTIDDHNAKIKKAISDGEKLKVIASTIWEIEHIHPFTNGNIRLCVLLLNRLLLQHNFKNFAVFDNPNIIDNISKEELVDEIKIAMQNFENIKKKKEGEIGGFDTRTIPENTQHEFRIWSARLYWLTQLTSLLNKKPIDYEEILFRLKTMIENVPWKIGDGYFSGKTIKTKTESIKIPGNMYLQWKEINAAIKNKHFNEETLNSIIKIGKVAYENSSSKRDIITQSFYEFCNEVSEFRHLLLQEKTNPTCRL